MTDMQITFPRETMRQTMLRTAREYGLTEKEIRERTRTHRVVYPRMIAMARQASGRSLGRVGRFWGMDHTSVHYAKVRVASGIIEDAARRFQVE